MNYLKFVCPYILIYSIYQNFERRTFRWLKDWESFNDLHDQHSWRPFVHCIALHAVLLIFINFIYAVLLCIICDIDYRFFSIGFSLYVGSFRDSNLFAFWFFGSEEIFVFESTETFV